MNSLNNLSPPLNIGIIGLGAIGCLLSSQIPHENNIFALPSNPNLIKVNFRLDSADRVDHYSLPVWQNETLDIVIICCKAIQCISALDLWQPAINDHCQLVLLQNGMGQHEQVSSRFPNHLIFAASTTEGAFKKKQNHIVHAGQGLTQWGYYFQSKVSRTPSLKLDISQLKGQHKWSDDIAAVLFSKLAINAIINPLTVKYNCLNGGLISNVKIKNELKDLCAETEGFFKEMQWPLDFDLMEKVLLISQLTAENISSMLQDVKAKRETEIDFINGYLLSRAKSINYPLPRQQALFNRIKSLDSSAPVVNI